MSHASTHLVHCARTDLGCTVSFPGSKWDTIRATAAGWFFSRQEDKAFCPQHTPDWVAGWRVRKDQPKVVTSFDRQPAVAGCLSCHWIAAAASTEDQDYNELRERAYDHAKKGHKVVVTTTQVLTMTMETETANA